MSLDITPTPESGRQIIESYGEGRFRISAQRFEGHVLILPRQTQTWDITLETPEMLAVSHLDPLGAFTDEIDILILGCGKTFLPPSGDIRAHLRARGVALEWMATGAACRTYNTLAIEGRRVAAALLAVD